MGETLGNASVQYGDLIGTAAIDGPDQEERLYELAGLSHDKWHILGYEIYGGYGSTYAHIWAVPAAEVDYEQWEAAAKQGETTVRAQRFDFQAGSDEAGLELLKLNKRWSIHAIHGPLVKLGLDLERTEGE